MDCREVRSMLSEFVDGELSDRSARRIEQHLDECADCLAEYEYLRSTASLLSSTPEVEPPAFLLDAIMAATVDKPSTVETLRTLLLRLRVPVQAAVAVGAAAVLLFAGVIVQHEKGSEGITRIAAVPPPTIVQVEPPVLPEVTIEKTPEVKVVAEVHKPAVKRSSTHYVHRRTAYKPKPVTVAKSIAPKPKAVVVKKSPAPPVPEVKEVQVASEPVPVATPAPSPAADTGVKVASISSTERMKAEISAVNDLHQKITERNRARSYFVYSERVDTRKVSVGLATIRF